MMIGNNKTSTEYRTPNIKKTEKVFAEYQSDQGPDPSHCMPNYQVRLAKT